MSADLVRSSRAEDEKRKVGTGEPSWGCADQVEGRMDLVLRTLADEVSATGPGMGCGARGAGWPPRRQVRTESGARRRRTLVGE